MKIIIIILQAILNLVRKRRDLIANRSKIPNNIKNAIKAIYDPKKQGMAKLRLEFPASTRILFLKLPTSTILKVV
jgi:hypothetical protein